MELLYVWIKEYKNIKEQGFNFSPKWRFHYHPDTGKLDVGKQKGKSIKDFFDSQVSGITLIVGENGSGKSNLLEFLCDYFDSLSGVDDVIIIYQSLDFVYIQVGKSLKFEKNGLSKIFKKRELKLLRTEDNEELPQGYDYDANIVFYSNFMDYRNDKSVVSNISTAFLYREDFLAFYPTHVGIGKELTFQEKVEVHLFNENRRQIKFAEDFKKDGYIPFEMPSEAILTYEVLVRDFNSGFFSYEQNNLLKECFLKIEDLRIGNEVGKKYLLINLKIDILFKLIHFRKDKDENQIYNVIKVLKRYNNKKDIDLNNLILAILELVSIEESTTLYLIKFLNFIEEKIEDNSISMYIEFNKKYLEIEFKDSQFELLSPFLDLYEEVFSYVPFFQFNWRGISSGERSFLSLFSRFYDKYLIRSFSKNYLILLDEASIGFHPKWEARFIKTLLDFFPTVLYSNEEFYEEGTIQFILTSHSPFVLSDLPKENVIFLKKGEGGKCQVVEGLNDMKQTFGANIHTLLSDGFFMDGLMGDFAKEKIDKVTRYVNDDLQQGETLSEEEAEKTIRMIGEPIVKRYLQQQMDFKKKKKADANEKRIEALEDKIKLLEAALKTKSND